MSNTVIPNQGCMTILHKLDQLLESVHMYIMRYDHTKQHQTAVEYYITISCQKRVNISEEEYAHIKTNGTLNQYLFGEWTRTTYHILIFLLYSC